MTSVSYTNHGGSLQVGKILCLGRNYREHAREMGADVPAEPVVFMKPSTALLLPGQHATIPPYSREMHHEVELVVLIGRTGRNIPRERALEHIGGYGVGLDFTLRDLQAEAKKRGLPWTVAKGFDGSAPVSEFLPAAAVPDPHALEISLKLNGQVRQHASTGEMIFRVEDILAYISRIFTLEAGDLIFTGTPAGVGPVSRGDVLEASLGHLVTLTVSID